MHPSSLRDATISLRRSYGILAAHLPEFLAVKAGMKRALQITLGDEETFRQEEKRIRRFCEEASLACRFHVRHGRHKVILAKDVLEPPSEYEDENEGNRFSYPDCCWKKFLANPLSCPSLRHVRDLIAHGQRHPFVVNPFLVSTPFHLVSWHPCSLDCASTIAHARALFDLVRLHVPMLADAIRHWNRRPVLFTDICGIALCFDGKLEGSILHHRGCEWVGVPSELAPLVPGTNSEDLKLFDHIVAAVMEGDEVELEATTIAFRRQGQLLGRLERPSRLSMAMVDFFDEPSMS